MQAELEKNLDGSVQLRLLTDHGYVDLMFVSEDEFLGVVAGQHVGAALAVLRDLPVS